MKKLYSREELPAVLGLTETQILDLAQSRPLPPMQRVCGVSFFHIADLNTWIKVVLGKGTPAKAGKEVTT